MCHECFTFTSSSGHQALSNAEVCESLNASVIKQCRFRRFFPSDVVSVWIGDHLIVPHAKLLFFSIGMLISPQLFISRSNFISKEYFKVGSYTK